MAEFTETIKSLGDQLVKLTLKDAVDLARKEGHSDRDIAVLLKVDEDRVKAIPRIEPIIKLEDLQFRPENLKHVYRGILFCLKQNQYLVVNAYRP